MKAQIYDKVADSISVIPLFEGMDPDSLEAIAKSVKTRNLSADEVAFIEGNKCAGLYIVQEG